METCISVSSTVSHSCPDPGLGSGATLPENAKLPAPGQPFRYLRIFGGSGNRVLIPYLSGEHMPHNNSDIWFPQPLLSRLFSYNASQMASHPLESVTPELKGKLQECSLSRTHHLCPGVYTSVDIALGCFSFLSHTSVQVATPPLSICLVTPSSATEESVPGSLHSTPPTSHPLR